FRFSALDPIPGYHEPFNLNEDGDTEMVAIYGLDTKDTTGGGDDTPVAQTAPVYLTNVYLSTGDNANRASKSAKTMKLVDAVVKNGGTYVDVYSGIVWPTMKTLSGSLYAYYGFALFDEKGNQVGDVMWLNKQKTEQTKPTNIYTSPNQYDDNGVYLAIPKTTPDGSYRLKPMCRIDGTANWLQMNTTQSEVPYLATKIENGTCTVSKEMETLKVNAIKCDGNMTIGSQQRLVVNISNLLDAEYNGTLKAIWGSSDFNHGEIVNFGEFKVTLAGGVTKNFTIDFTPTTETHNIRITTNNSTDGLLLAEELTFRPASTTEMTMDVDINVANKKDESHITGNTFKADVTIQNAGEEEYYDNMKVVLVADTLNANTGEHDQVNQIIYSELTQMAAGEPKNIPVEVAGLNYDYKYMLRVVYKKTSTEETSVESPLFDLTKGLMYWKGNGAVGMLEEKDGKIFVPKEAAAVDFYTVRPANATTVELEDGGNPNCIYYYSEYSYGIANSLKGKNLIAEQHSSDYGTYVKIANLNLQDGYDFYVPRDFTVTGKITYTRVFKNTESFYGSKAFYGTIVLPFAPTKVMNTDDDRELTWDMTSANVHRFWLKKFYYVDGTDIKFQASNEFLANVPYIITVPCT
ncbi:MAG: hypothetical protein ILA22_03200, partial [Prevotella sp.]|nr:hypothetical protein [Prevotella sp.]